MIPIMNTKEKNKRIRKRHKRGHSIIVLFLLYQFLCFLFKNNRYTKNDAFNGLFPIQPANAYASRTECTSSTDDSTCRLIIFGELHMPSNSVERLKVIRGKGKGVFVTLRREYVILSYYLKYLKDIPDKFIEKVETMSHSSYKSYTDSQLDLYVSNCLSNSPRSAHIKDTDISDEYLKVTAGKKCECPGYKLFNGRNPITRASLDCNLAKLAFYPSTIVFSRHCAIMGPAFYSVYSVDYPPIFNTYVKVKLQEYILDDPEAKKKKETDLVKTEKEYILDDSVKFIRDDYFDITIILRSEQQGKIGIVNLSDDYIVLPSSPVYSAITMSCDTSNLCGLGKRSHLLNACDYTKGLCKKIHPCLRNGLMISSDEFDITGNTCSKLGVSYNRWRSPAGGNFCSSTAGACLERQLETYISQHSASIKSKTASPYKIRNVYGSEPQTRLFGKDNAPEHLQSLITKESSPEIKISDHSMKLMGHTAKHPLFIDYKYNGDHITEIYFETTAVDVYRINLVADGAITHIVPPADCDAQKRESIDCVLTVHAWNSSKRISANFSCVVQCKQEGSKKLSPHIAPIEPISAYIEADKNHAFYFVIKFLTQAKTETSCDVYLLDSTRKIRSVDKFSLQSKEIVKVIDKDVREYAPPVTITKFEEDEQKGEEVEKEFTCGCGINIFCYIFNLRKCIAYFVKKIFSLIGKFLFIGALIFLFPVILPFLPFIIKYAIKCCFIPFKLLRLCISCTKKMSFKKKKKDKKDERKKSSNFFQKLKKKKKSPSSSLSPSPPLSPSPSPSLSEKDSSLSEPVSSDNSYSVKKKTKTKKKFTYDSPCSGISSKETSSTISTISITSSINSDRTFSRTSKKFKKLKRSEESEDASSSINSSISLSSDSETEAVAKKKKKKKVTEERKKKLKNK